MARIGISIAAILLVPFPVSHAQSRGETRPAGLRPGEYVWREARADGGPLAIVISLPSQLAYVYRGGRLIGVSTVSTGKRGKATPTGAFAILQKKTFHRSNLYSNAPMPYMQRLTWDGIAIHGGDLPGYPASHGCIRLPQAFARKLFEMTEMGGVVRVVDTEIGDTLPVERALPPVLVAARKAPMLTVDRAVYRGDRVTTPAPRIALVDADVRFAAYDVAVADGYGAKGGRGR